MYSQQNEEQFILSNTPERGMVLDIGACWPTIFSNSRALIERNWGAVLIEPSAGPFLSLIEAYKNNPRVILVNAFVGNEWKIRNIHMSPDALTTGVEKNYKEWKDRGQFTETVVAEVPLSAILMAHPGPYDFVSIDTEGSSVDILRQIQLNVHGVNLVCVEHDGRKAEVEKYFYGEGFTIIHENAANIIAKRI